MCLIWYHLPHLWNIMHMHQSIKHIAPSARQDTSWQDLGVVAGREAHCGTRNRCICQWCDDYDYFAPLFVTWHQHRPSIYLGSFMYPSHAMYLAVSTNGILMPGHLQNSKIRYFPSGNIWAGTKIEPVSPLEQSVLSQLFLQKMA